MTRRSPTIPLIVANWKMQLGISDSHERLTEVKQRLKTVKGKYQAVVCPSFLALPEIKKILRGSSIQLGAQDVFWSDKGAFTGAVSPLSLQEVGVEYVILGHSERRQLMGETDEMVGRKVMSAMAHGIIPIICVGETAHERNEGQHEIVVRRQVVESLRSMPPTVQQRIYIAYEPIWSISTNANAEPADPDDVQNMLMLIRQTMIERFSPEFVDQHVQVLYGGSVDEKNASQYVSSDRFHGALVGGASLIPEKFATLITNITKHF